MTTQHREVDQSLPQAVREARDAQTEPGDRCAHTLCSCANAPVVRNAANYCSQLCADAADLVDKNTTLCPCLHQGCEGNGDKPIPPEERRQVGTATR